MKNINAIILALTFLMIISCGVESKKYNPETFSEDIKEFSPEDRKRILQGILITPKEDLKEMSYGELIDLFEEDDESADETENNEEGQFNWDQFRQNFESNKRAVIPIDILLEIHSDNYVNCHEYFNEKYFCVSGVIESITLNEYNNYIVSFKTKRILLGGVYAGMLATSKEYNISQYPCFPKGNRDVSNLHAGDVVTIFGKCIMSQHGIAFSPSCISSGNEELVLKKQKEYEDSVAREYAVSRIQLETDNNFPSYEDCLDCWAVLRMENNNDFSLDKISVQVEVIYENDTSYYIENFENVEANTRMKQVQLKIGETRVKKINAKVIFAESKEMDYHFKIEK